MVVIIELTERLWVVFNTRIALIHALEESVKPAHQAFESHWREAFVFDLIDTSLSADLAQLNTLEGSITKRIEMLAQYASRCAGIGGSTAGILFTCSAFGPAINAVKSKLSIPVLRPNEAAFEAAIDIGRRIGVIATFPPSVVQLEKELRSMMQARGLVIELEMQLAEGALEALKNGDVDRHDSLIADAAVRLNSPDVVVLGQFSMARAGPLVERMQVTGKVVTTPESAVLTLKRLHEAHR